MKTRANRFENHVLIPSGQWRLSGILRVPTGAIGAVALAHAGDSGRFSPRSRSVADVLDQAGFATLRIDLLEESEAEDHNKAFDVELLANRLQHVAEWLAEEPETQKLPLAYYGGGTGGAAALLAAARYPAPVRAVVSREGPPDLEPEDLREMRSPTLLIVSGDDTTRQRNREMFDRLRCSKQMVVINGAGQGLADPDAIEVVARLARDWFVRYAAHAAAPNEGFEHASANGARDAAKT